MKKVLALVLATIMLFSITALAEGEVKMGQALAGAHGTKCFTVATVAMDGDTIVGVYLDEYQFMGADDAAGVPNSDTDFGTNFPEGQVLGSKKVNNEYYSKMMTDYAQATNTIVDNYAAIEAFCTGKTVAELEAAVEGQDAAGMVDAVSSCTLVDTLGYVNAVIAAAKNVK